MNSEKRNKIKYTDKFLEEIDTTIIGLVLLGYRSDGDYRYFNTDNDTKFILSFFSDNIFLKIYHDNKIYSKTYYHGEENDVIKKLQSLT